MCVFFCFLWSYPNFPCPLFFLQKSRPNYSLVIKSGFLPMFPASNSVGPRFPPSAHPSHPVVQGQMPVPGTVAVAVICHFACQNCVQFPARRSHPARGAWRRRRPGRRARRCAASARAPSVWRRRASRWRGCSGSWRRCSRCWPRPRPRCGVWGGGGTTRWPRGALGRDMGNVKVLDLLKGDSAGLNFR